MIPHLIHQSWKTSLIPFEVYPKSWQDSWKTLHPLWEYRLWTDADNERLVATHYPQFLAFFRRLDLGIKKADFSRFLYMHRFGGIYVDLDFIALQNLSPLLEGASIVVGQLSEANHYYRFPNAFLAAEPGNKFWMDVANDAMNAPPHEQSVETLSGPFRLGWALDLYRPAGLKILDQALVYPFDWISFTHWDNGIHYRADQANLAIQFREMELEAMQQALPNSFAVTTWNHHW